MWALRHLREFGNSVDDHHAICLGLFLTFPMWWLIVKYGASDESSRLLASKTWYVALGTTVQAVGLILLVKGVF